jgi:hypothetical protein
MLIGPLRFNAYSAAILSLPYHPRDSVFSVLHARTFMTVRNCR